MKIRGNSKGTTILEMVIITVVVGISATLAVPRFGQVMEKLRFKTAGRDIVSSLRLARSSAVSQRSQFGVYFDMNSGQYIVFMDKANPGSFTYDAGADSDVVTKTLPPNVNYAYASFPNFAVVFRPNGSASSSGAVYLYSCEDYENPLSIDVLASTGRVKLISGYHFD